jgi:RNA polymerase sigma factor (sigma-70 family)
VLRRAMNRQMKERSLHEPLDESEIIVIPENERPGLMDIRGLLSILSTREEEVLLLRLEALKYREIADQLGISVNSVNTLLARALRKLQQATARKTSEGSVKGHEKKNITRAS